MPISTVRVHHTPARLVTATLITLTLLLTLLTATAPKAIADTGDDTLWAGQTLLAGEQLVSTDAQFRAVVQGDGNVVIYGSSGPVWANGSFGSDPELAMQTDGNLVAYASGRPRWFTGTFGSDARLVMQNDGNLVLYLGTRAVWSSFAGRITVRPEGPDTLNTGQQLTGGQQLVSPNARYIGVLQTDGNFVVYDGGRALFASGTSGTANPRLVMQGDGNLVLYDSFGARWNTGTSGANARLALQDDGNLVLYVGSRAAWTRTAGVISVQPPPVPSRSTLRADESLSAGQQLTNGRFVAALQSDGNFVVYDGGRAVFASATSGTANARLVVQGDGNVVLYGSSGARWQTGTRGTNPELALQSDGNLVVYAGGRASWTIRGGLIPEPGAPSSPGTPSGPRPGTPYHPPGCDVKGNINETTKERIYHVPGGAFYDRTIIGNEPGELWFCSPSDAVAAGWRASER